MTPRLALSDRIRLFRRARGRAARVAAAERAFDAALAGLGAGDIALDCGANVGLVAERIAATGATLHAFEPDPDAFAALSARLGGRPDVHLHEAAVGLSEGRLPLYGARGRSPGSTAGSVSSTLSPGSRRVAEAPFAEVRVIDLPAFLASLPADPALVKIDIEGSEVAILEHLLDTGRAARMGRVFVETHEKQRPDLAPRTLALVDRAARLPGRPINLDWG